MSVQARIDRVALAAAAKAGFRRLSALAVVVGSTACNSVAPIPVETLVRQGDVYLHPQTLQPYSGSAVVTVANQLRARETYAGGVKQGPYEWYFDNGQLFEKGTYHDGHLDGRFYAYWGNADLYEEGVYLHGEFEGPRAWYLEGRLIELVTYRHGVFEGPYARYQGDGSIAIKGTFFNGAACGTWLEGTTTLRYPACGMTATD